MALEIVPARERDVPLLLSFIAKLADHEGLRHKFVATEAGLRDVMFGARPLAEAVLAYVDGAAAGCAIFLYAISTYRAQPVLFVEDLYVDQEHRGKGIGKALLAHLARTSEERGCARLEWNVLRSNTLSIEFYKSLGAVASDDWVGFHLSGEALGRLSRREILAALAGLCLAPRVARADVAEPGPMMLPRYLAARLAATISTSRAPSKIEDRNQFVRTKIRELLGRFPERTPLNARVVKKTDRDGYRIENVMYESRPGLWVTANLWIPTRGAGPYPGILSPCGHYDNSRFYPDYQFAHRNMVENGFVVLAFDPMGQGERRHFWNPAEPPDKAQEHMQPTTEHSLAGHMLALLGESVNQYFVWDGMRGIDYLLSRPEVDPKRIGCAGHSGGGTATMYLSSIDERIRCVAVHQGGLAHQFSGPVEQLRLSPSDCEQNLFGAAMFRIDSAEIHSAISPRPLLVTIENYHPRFDQAAEYVKKRYELLGAAERFATVEAQAPHAWTRKLRIASTDWFCRFFYDRPGPADERDYQLESEETLRCVPNGSLRYSGYDTAFTYIHKKAAAVRPATPRDLPTALRASLRVRKIDTALSVREIAPGRVHISSEDGIALHAIVVGKSGPPVVYLDDEGAEAAVKAGRLAPFSENGRRTIAVDVRGIGASKPEPPPTRQPPIRGSLFNFETWASYVAWQLEDSLLGMRVSDAIRSVDFALSLDPSQKGAHLIGSGMGAIWALFAAALDSRISSLECRGGLLSYATLAQSDRSLHSANVVIRGVLQSFDLPDVAASIAGRPLQIIDPVDAMKQPVDIAIARSVYRRTADAYALKSAADRFQILHSR